MTSSRSFWKLLLGNVVFLAIIVGLGTWLTVREVTSIRQELAQTSATVDSIEAGGVMRRVAWKFAPVMIVGAGAYALLLRRFWRRPVESITEAARSLARGELTTEVPIIGSAETRALARAMNRMRDRVARHLETIERQRETLESLVAQVHEGVVVADPNGRLFTVNPAAVRLLDLRSNREDGSFEGMPVEQCIIDHDVQTILLHPEQRTSNLRGEQSVDVSHAIGAGDSTFREVSIEVETNEGPRSLLARASDIVLPGFVSPSDPFVADAKPGRLLVLTDITDLIKTIQVKADFAANASHELRTPLSAIRMAVETLKSMDLAEDAAPAAHFLDVILRHCRRLEEMVKDLLDLSRVESPNARFESEMLDTYLVLDELHMMFAPALQDKELRWEVDIDDRCPRLFANPVLLRLVLSNLIENAIKFTAGGGLVRVTARATEYGVELSVSDTGCGIPPEDQARVFERFYQVHRARSGQARGTGLGLSIVRHAVGAMGATISLSSAVGEGTTVTVTIPQSATRGEVETFKHPNVHTSRQA